jgi:hypothetical protein
MICVDPFSYLAVIRLELAPKGLGVWVVQKQFTSTLIGAMAFGFADNQTFFP